MGFFEQFPYTNFHELNLDWLLDQMKKLGSAFDAFVETNILKYSDPIDWSINNQYEANTIVRNGEDVYLSKQAVPAGVAVTNTDYWFQVGDLSTYQLQLDSIRAQIDADNEGTNIIASQAYAAGAVFWLNDYLSRATAQIAAGESFILGGNYERVTVMDLLENIDNVVASHTEEIAALKEGRQYVLIGDSYGEGYTNSGYVTSWIDIARTQLNVIGYAAAGGYAFSRSDKNFLDLLQTITADISDATDIIVLGGANERYGTLAACENGIQAFCNYCATNYPEAVVRIGWVGYANTQTVRWQERTFRNAYYNCGRFGASYLGNIHYAFFANSLVATSDIEHPNANGQAQIASALISILEGGDFHVSHALGNITLDTTLINVGTVFYLGSYDNTVNFLFTNPAAMDLTNVTAGSVRNTYQKIGTWADSPVPTGTTIQIGEVPVWLRQTSGTFDPNQTTLLIFLQGSDVLLGLSAKKANGTFADWSDYNLMYIDFNVGGGYTMTY